MHIKSVKVINTTILAQVLVFIHHYFSIIKPGLANRLFPKVLTCSIDVKIIVFFPVMRIIVFLPVIKILFPSKLRSYIGICKINDVTFTMYFCQIR